MDVTAAGPDAADVFRARGYARLNEFVTDVDLELVRFAVDRAVDAAQDTSCERPNNTLVPLRWNDPVVELVTSDEQRLCRLAQVVGAHDLRWISGYVSIKDPSSPPLWWHQDWWCWDHPVSFQPEAAQVAVLCYLSETSAANGALRVLPGSHLRSTRVHAVLPEAHSEASTALDPCHEALRDQAGQVTIEVRAGDAVVLDYRLLHGTHANSSERRRDCVLLSFAPSWRDLPVEIRGHLVRHPALPTPVEETIGTEAIQKLLPHHDGPCRDLELNRNAPDVFTVRPA